MNTVSTDIADVKLPADLLHYQRELDEAVAKAKRTRTAIDATAAQIPVLEADVQKLSDDLGGLDADLMVAEEDQVPALQTKAKKLSAEVEVKERTLNRARAALKVHEARAPELDGEVQAALIVLQQGMIAFGDTLMERLRAELLEKVRPLVGVFAALKAIAPIAGANVRDVIDSACVPDPKGFICLQPGGTAWMNRGTNLLANEPDPEHAALANAIASALAPIKASIAAAKALTPYVSLEQRRKMIPRSRGYAHDGVTRQNRTVENEPAQPPRPDIAGPDDRQPPGFKARVRTGRVGDLPPGTPVDGNIGPALVDSLMRDRGGSEFAV